MKRIRVLHIIHSLKGGGAERQLSLIHAGINSNDISSFIYCINGSGKFGFDTADSIFEASSKNSYTIINEMRSIIGRLDIDLVHLWLPSSITIPGALATLGLDVRVIGSFRNKMYFVKPVTVIDYLISLFVVDRIVSNNPPEQSAWYYKWLYCLKNGVFIPNAVSVSKRLSLNKPVKSNVFKFASFGRLTKQKNFLTAISAFDGVKASEWEYNIFGSGELKQNLCDEVDNLELSENVSIFDYCDDIEQKIVDCDCVIFPSLWEGMPNVLVEAVALGAKVIVSDILSNRVALDGFEGSFTWFDPGNPKELHMAIVSAMAEKESALEASVSDRIRERYSVDRLISSYKSFYISVVAGT